VKQRLKHLALRLFYFANLSKEATDKNQQIIRDVEWQAVMPYIPQGSVMLDVGCGTGYAIKRAIGELSCDCYGIDPAPGEHGVGRYGEASVDDLRILQGNAESLPYPDAFFDVVYSSHVLEHVNDESQSLAEMKRVLKPGGVLIIGMPSATMAWIGFFTEFFFTTHQRAANVLLRLFPFINTGNTPIINMIIPYSHSAPRGTTIFYDVRHYQVRNWRRIVANHFTIQREILPALYPFPQYWQLFKLRRHSSFASSVFFVCHK
jgi:ubiquinone/menaquinone biosynthesis C-methylase UbiE